MNFEQCNVYLKFRWALMPMLLTVVGLLASTASMAKSLVLEESWDTDNVSGYEGKVISEKIDEYTYVTTKTQSGVAGTAGTHPNTESYSSTTYAGMTGLTWYEDKDKPCSITLQTKSLNPVVSSDTNGVQQASPDKTHEFCKGKPGNSKSVVFTNKKYFIRGVAVCTSDKKSSANDRLKGIEIYAAEIKSDGTVVALKNTEKNQHTLCKSWHTPIYCPAGEIASTLKVNYKDDYYSGLGLGCRKVGLADSPFKP